MPELPEVETIRKGLEKYLVGRTIEDVEIRLPKMMQGDTQRVKGAIVQAVRRYGKGLVIDLNNGYSIAIHVKMTGQLVYQGRGVPSGSMPLAGKVGSLPGNATHVIFTLDQNDKLYYNDIRQFGWLKIVPTESVAELGFFKSLGPEALSSLTPEKFRSILTSNKSPIKPLLMEQKKIAGIGNIYANDALFLAKIHPSRPANSLSIDETTRLFNAIETVLRKGLEVGGASEWQYVNVLGEAGGYQNFFQVYGRVGKPCPNCGTTIEKIVMGGRGTFFCPTCQQ
jgi:formamidopyrimidine-DNA glycosylase